MGAAQSSCGVTTEGRQLLREVEEGAVAIVDARLKHNLGFVYWSTFSGGNTIWHKAAKAGQLGTLKAMARAVASAYDTPKDTQEACHQPQARLSLVLVKVGANSKEALKRLVNLVNFKRCTPLMLAAARGHADVVSWLLEQGAMLLVHDRIRHQTALHYAVEGGHIECVRLLLGAACHAAPSAAGAAAHGQTERQLLLGAGNHAGLTALHYAVHEEQYDAIKLLLAYGADINTQAEYPDLDWATVNAGDTSMHVAAAKGSIESIRILLKGFVETSGLLCPEHAPPRHIRDPRGVRNDYGRLPYHLAMRKRFTWLAELLDPSVPVRYLLTGEEPETATSFGPPRLAVIAAKVMHDKLMGELRGLKAASSPGGGAGGAPRRRRSSEGGGGHGEADPAQMNSLQVAHAAARAAAVAAAAATPRRRWSLNGNRRASSRCSGGSEGGAAAAGGAGAAAGAGAGSPGGLATLERLLSLPGRVVEVAAAAASAGGALQTAVDLRDPGPAPAQARSRAMSPRMSVASIPEEAAVAAPAAPWQHPQPLLAPPSPRPHPSPEPAAGGSRRCSGSGDEGCSGGGSSSSAPPSPLAAAFAHVSLALGAPALLDAKRKAAAHHQFQQQRQEGEGGGGPGDWIPAHQPQCELEPQPSGCSSAGGCSGAATPREEGGGGGAEKVTPNPELLEDGHGPTVLDGLLRPFRRSTSNRVAPAGPRGGATPSEDGVTCGVCLDALPAVCIAPCRHVMCVDCALDMCKRYSLGTAACPFCRSLVGGFRAATAGEMRQH
ncbi:MAG: ankyrin repeat-containing domain protein [Monoraphidium minutum]|nr:MAG: ankyrin repeat-containing domain protein [Monoraphidium minutum]